MWWILLLVAGTAATGPRVSLNQGPLLGVNLTSYSGRKIFGFLGVPYGKPPVGEKRFAAPEPAGPWRGVYHATSYPSPCMQYSQVSYMTEEPVFGVEDCLYLSVYTPKLPTTGATNNTLMDVIVYIHGGAFMFSFGGNNGPKYLLDKDVVLVVFTYRVGALGFLSTEDCVVPGNNGLKDQVLALEWIQNNIAAFGGDPTSVTIAGNSAGGASVHFHYLSPLSKGLFKGGISTSGVVLNAWSMAEGSREKAFKIGAEVGCPTNDSKELVKCLRSRPATQIASTTKLFLVWRYNPIAPFGPVVEVKSPNAFISEAPIDIMKAGKVQDLPWLTTFTSHEGLVPGAEIYKDLEKQRYLDKNWDKILPFLLDFNGTLPKEKQNQVSQQIRKHYLKDKSVENAFPEYVEMLGDRWFVADISKAAKLQALVNTAPVYAYRFSYRGKHSITELAGTKENLGASHADDIGYVFDRNNLNLNPTETEEDVKMVKTMVKMFVAFASTGTPTFEGEEERWPDVKSQLPDYLVLRDIISPISAPIKELSDAGQQKFWDSLGFAENIPHRG